MELPNIKLNFLVLVMTSKVAACVDIGLVDVGLRVAGQDIERH